MTSLWATVQTFFLTHKLLFQLVGYGSLLLVAASLLLLPWYINRLPADFFRNERYHTAKSLFHHPILNTIGALLFITGVLMLVLPGQGLITMAVGVMVMRFPGKLALLQKIARYPSVLHAMNWIRQRGKCEPFTL